MASVSGEIQCGAVNHCEDAVKAQDPQCLSSSFPAVMKSPAKFCHECEVNSGNN